MKENSLTDKLGGARNYKALHTSAAKRTEVTGLVGSAVSVALALYADAKKGVHTVLADDRESAAYLASDLIELMGEERVFFFPSAFKRSIVHADGREGTNRVQRTALQAAISHMTKKESIVVCTYPEAIQERVVSTTELTGHSITVKTGERISATTLTALLAELGFEKTDFVSEPGHYSWRGGIIDVFSYSDNHPYRIDFFGDEVESIRLFDVGTQRSVSKTEQVTIIPDLAEQQEQRVSLVEFIAQSNAAGATYWLGSVNQLRSKMDETEHKYRQRLQSAGEDGRLAEHFLTGSDALLESLKTEKLFFLRGDTKELPADKTIAFDTSLQPSFSKNFDLLAANLNENRLNGYTNYILTPNKAQMERLENIFGSMGRMDIHIENIPVTLHAGFIDHDARMCFYTDHQIFERYHRYKLNREVQKSQTLTVSELNALQPGDYIVHIDHGIGRFGGLVKSVEGGRTTESIKLVYRDNDVLLVNIHSLHKISKYKDKDSIPPAVNKLGSAAWQRFKNSTKSKVKEIAKELIALYAKRRHEKGYAFHKDNYLQYELEASFIYEDTPDQQKATEAFKADMESPVPMDRLICGDVGFGKTEIAVRAAFKAVCDSKQVAVLVPTTLLTYQHYRTFSRRLKRFPATIENLSRSKSAKETKEIIQKLKEGKIDIIIGTHKLLGKQIEFKDLGLLIIDEEQKFGVASKEKLRQLKSNVDTLTLTATPIPRTLQFSLMGARDLSIINTPPPNRQPVATEVHTFDEELIKEAIETELARGGQVFFVHNKINSIYEIEGLVNRLCPGARTAVGHGQMPGDKLEAIMMDFIYGEFDVLIATTIIESGIDIPNANTMIINDAQNFGLSELHQLRGRVGRTNKKAYCYLFTPSDTPLTDTAHRRLKAIEDFSDLGAGFNIAMQDLDIRGAGNILGAEQSGFIADIGFETYYKILNEAMAELQEEQGETETPQLPEPIAEPKKTELKAYISDCQVDTDSEALIPDSYIANTNEKLRIYKAIDRITTERELQEIEADLTDRFGTLPEAASELLHIVLLRRNAVELGFEKVIVKNGYFILHFIYNQQSAYYKTATFSALLEYISKQGENFKFKPKEDKMLLSVRGIGNCREAYRLTEEMKAFVLGKQREEK